MGAFFNEDLPQRRGSFVNAPKRNGSTRISRTVYAVSHPLRWFSFRNHDGTVWTTEWSSHEISAELRGKPGSNGLDGYTQPSDKLITLDSASFRSVQDFITLHEVMHASLDKVDGVSGRAEENVITQMAPRLYPILRKFGLRWPDRPEGFVALERRARRNSK